MNFTTAAESGSRLTSQRTLKRLIFFDSGSPELKRDKNYQDFKKLYFQIFMIKHIFMHVLLEIYIEIWSFL